MSEHTPRMLGVGLIVLFTLVWNSAFIVGKIAVPAFNPFTTLCVRFFISVLLLGIWCKLRMGSLGDKKLVRFGLLLGIVNNVVYLGLTFSSLKYIPAGWVVIITACSPFMTIALAALMRLERLSVLKLLGMAVGFAGVVVITGVGEALGQDMEWGVLLALLGTLAFSCGTVMFRGRAVGMSIAQLNLWQSVSGAVLLLPLVLLYEGAPPAPSLAGAVAIGWLVVVTILGMWLWYVLIRLWGAGTAASFHLMNPVTGLFLAFVILGAVPTLWDAAGALLVGTGLLIILWGSKREVGVSAQSKG